MAVADVVRHINEVNLRRVWLILGCVAVGRRVNHFGLWYVTSRPGQLSLAIPPWRRNEYQRKLRHEQAHRAMYETRIRGLAGETDVWLRANEKKISAALWALWLGELMLKFSILTLYNLNTGL